ncbi:hypothetical protein [Erythrobacter sp. HL-111]|uniref:rhamnosyltransferase WsaF family glycosyltransferase n=1 Tax=Erythrobacter sp. HL-111 TaxID=1798193 RepID=UPI0006D9F111|nr:hypothetical protein [Erythrobacter sp. HL-111]KPP94405.1 MAG: hypothetical protein HLUCCO15_04470 [Erythrobacteraceae bacterium HL-111]SDS54990.1 hypothetical protein SAMN04515621_1772 [Erythrobacter sp. HL-111]
MTIASTARSLFKRKAPPQLKALFLKVRAGFAPPPIDDVVLAEYRAMPDKTATARLNLVLPLLQKGSDFGGTATGIDIFSRLYLELAATEAIDLRVLVTDVVAETDPSIVTSRAAKAGLTISPGQIETVQRRDDPIAIRERDLFVTYNWWTTLAFAKLRDAQATLFDRAPVPLVWLMQDYEPAFMPFSSAHLLARAAYDGSQPLWGVINSGNLARYIRTAGHRPERSFVFEPVIPDGLRPYLDRVATSPRHKRVLVYGRPTVERNCFPALVRGLRRWARDYPQFSDWQVVSAGVEHGPVDLGDGRKLRSVGKLSLDAYAEMLLGSSAGVSLMASPHPSYPPLEMAHFGLRTITNSYLHKDLSRFHPNITSLESIAEEPLAQALADACGHFGTGPTVHRNPDYLRDDAYPFMTDLRDAVRQELRSG